MSNNDATKRKWPFCPGFISRRKIRKQQNILDEDESLEDYVLFKLTSYFTFLVLSVLQTLKKGLIKDMLAHKINLLNAK